jgi:hypothetical protein
MDATANRWVVWIAATLGIAAIGGVDFLTGNEVRVFPLYFVPISLVAWHVGRSGAFIAAALSTVFWLESNRLAGLEFSHPSVWVANTLVQGASFALVGFLIASLKGHLEAERQARAVSEEALANVRQLSALLPMCSSCKKIRNESGESWVPFDVYLLEHSDSRVSHGVCPDCMAKLYPEQFKRLRERKANTPE